MFTDDDGESKITLQQAAIRVFYAGKKMVSKIVEFVDEMIFEGDSAADNINDDMDFDFRNFRDPTTLDNLGPMKKTQEEDNRTDSSS
jgi:hypothetical protein